MKILAIETSCDETAIAILDFSGSSTSRFEVLSDITLSQIEKHQEYGGVYPALAKREHQKNIFPLLKTSLENAGLLRERDGPEPLSGDMQTDLESILERESDVWGQLAPFFESCEVPDIDAVAVTYGPGLEIALWTGFNVARALARAWEVPLVPINHMEGHIYSSLIHGEEQITVDTVKYPTLALLISGGHTELVLIRNEFEYKKIGETLDDAVGEAYDKSARLMSVPYPGGPKVSEFAENYREMLLGSQASKLKVELLPRPLLHSRDLNFSFSGLKTAVLRESQKLIAENEGGDDEMTQSDKEMLSYEFEEAVAEVLLKKTKKAIEEYNIQDLIIGGGVSANTSLRREFGKLCDTQGVKLHLPERKYTGDNALMIAVAGARRYFTDSYPKDVERVDGNLSL